MGRVKECGVCNEAQSKYKCPSCLLPYCSLLCFKKHKEIPCSKPLPPEEKPGHLVPPERSFQVDDKSWVLQSEWFQSIAESAEIREALKDEHIRDIVRLIDSSKDPEGELDKAMQGQEFSEFTDKVLSIVSPQE